METFAVTLVLVVLVLGLAHDLVLVVVVDLQLARCFGILSLNLR